MDIANLINDWDGEGFNQQKLASFQSRIPQNRIVASNIFEAIGLLDYTSLDSLDTKDKILKFLNKGFYPGDNLPSVGGVCVFTRFLEDVKFHISNNALDVKACSVAGGFPHGQATLGVKLFEVKEALSKGADEIDLVANRGFIIEGNYRDFYDEIRLAKYEIHNIKPSVKLKVILESGELPNLADLRLASRLALHAGADFIKTSTGKTSVGAKFDAVYVMLEEIKRYYELTGDKKGIKPSGGIKSTSEIVTYIELVREVLGEEWVNRELLRFGASGILDNLINDYQLVRKGSNLPIILGNDVSEGY